MSTQQTQNRQPKGTPTGGQWAETRRADAEGVELVDPEQGACVLTGAIHEDPDDCTTHTHESDGLPAPDSDEADPWLYDGDNVDALAARDNWAPKDWENYYDARHERELDEAHSAPIEHEGVKAQLMTSPIDGAVLVQVDTPELAPGRKVRVAINDGDVYDGDPETDETIDQKLAQAAQAGRGYAPKLNATMELFHAAKEQMERMSAGLVVEMVRDAYPKAQYITLEHSDQGDYWAGVEILGDDRETVGDWEDIEYGEYEDDAIALSNFSSESQYPFIVESADGRTVYLDLDAAEKYARGEH